MRRRTRYNLPVLAEPRVGSRIVLLALAVAGGLACAEVRDTVDAGMQRDGLGASLEAGTDSLLNCLTEPPEALEPMDLSPADVLILLDRSESMGAAFGAGTRYQAVASALSEIVAAYPTHVRFGYQELPGRLGCASQSLAACCVSPPSVAIAWDSAAAVTSAIGAASPLEGASPVASALRAASAYYDDLDDGLDNRYVLLATDGAPTCTLAGALSSGLSPEAPACADALAAVAALAAASVRVIVLGVGPDLANDATGGGRCLDALAHAGGAAASPGSPGYYSASDPGQLRLAIERIFGGIARKSCVFRIPMNKEKISNLAVFLDGQRIPKNNQDGWWQEDVGGQPLVRITGKYCDQIESFAVDDVEARYTCPPCVDVTECNAKPSGGT